MHANPVFGEVPTEMQAYIALLVQQAVQRQQEQQQQELQLLVQRLDELEAENAQLKEWLAKLGVDCGATALRAKQQLDDGVSANNRVQELAEQQQQLEMRLQQQLSDIAPRLPSKCVVHAPADYTPQLVREDVCAAAKLSTDGVDVCCVYVPRNSNGDNSSSSSSNGGNNGNNGGDNGSGSGSGSGSRRKQTAVWVLTLRNGGDVRAILSGRTRSALKAANKALFVDSYLSQAQRERRKQLQPMQRQLRSQGVHTRWVVDQLQQKVHDVQGRWSWQPVGGPET